MRLLELLLGAEHVGVAALLLAAVDRSGMQASVALAADHLLAIVLPGKHSQGRLNDTSSQSEDQVKSGLLLDVVVAQGAAILQLLASEDQSLLIRRDAFLILDFGLDVVDGVGRLHIECDSFAREGLNEDLHLRDSAQDQSGPWFRLTPEANLWRETHSSP